MATEIKTWEIIDGTLSPLETTIPDRGKAKNLDLETWLQNEPSIISPGLKVIGRQVVTQSGLLDLLAVDQNGSLVVIEIKQKKLPREALAHAIELASDAASWPVDKIREVCVKHTGQGLEDVMSEAFPEVDLESLKINASQRIVLVGFAIDPALERMVEWLAGANSVGINAVVLKYIRTSAGNEVLTRTAIVSEDVPEEQPKAEKFTIPMSDEPGTYAEEELTTLLRSYLSSGPLTAQRIRDVLLPACLWRDVVTREEIKDDFVQRGAVSDPSKVGYVMSLVSSQLGAERNDFLRQVIGYEYPNQPWEKDNFFVRSEYRPLVQALLNEFKAQESKEVESESAA